MQKKHTKKVTELKVKKEFCNSCLSSCQTACKTSATVSNITCDKEKE